MCVVMFYLSYLCKRLQRPYRWIVVPHFADDELEAPREQTRQACRSSQEDWKLPPSNSKNQAALFAATGHFNKEQSKSLLREVSRIIVDAEKGDGSPRGELRFPWGDGS